MAGFGKVIFKGEYFNQQVINILHYRSAAWLPFAGNPFDDVTAFVATVKLNIWTYLRDCLPNDYTLRTVEGVGYDDAYNVVTASPLILTVNEPGTVTANSTMGAASAAIISLRCGTQHSINGTGVSRRNRGYLAIGPMAETAVDNYSHLSSAMTTNLGALAAAAAASLTIISPAVSLVPVRIHEKWSTILGIKHLDWRTYSDVQGYRINQVASYRKSRQPEA